MHSTTLALFIYMCSLWLGFAAQTVAVVPQELSPGIKLAMVKLGLPVGANNEVLSPSKWEKRRQELHSAALELGRAKVGSDYEDYLLSTTVAETTAGRRNFSNLGGILQMFTDCERLTNQTILNFRDSSLHLVTEVLLSLHQLQPNDPALLDVMSRFANKMRNDDGFRLAEALAKSDDFDGMSSRIGRGVVACPWRYGKVVELKFKDIEGGEVNLESLKGKVVLLDFWSTTCGPCIATIPKLKRLKEKFGREFEIIGVSLDEDIVSVKRFLGEKIIQWPQFFDGNGWHNEIAKKFGVIRLPTVWLIDKRGNLREVDPTEDFLERKIKFLLSD